MFDERVLRDNPVKGVRPMEVLVEVVSSRQVPFGKVLNLERGIGDNSLYLAQEGYTVAAVGFYPGDVEEVKRRAEETHARIATFVAEPTNLPFHSREFDLVTDMGVSIGLDDRELPQFLKEVHRVLRPGGRFMTLVNSYKGGVYSGLTREMIEDRYHPPFEVARIVETTSTETDQTSYFYSVLLSKE